MVLSFKLPNFSLESTSKCLKIPYRINPNKNQKNEKSTTGVHKKTTTPIRSSSFRNGIFLVFSKKNKYKTDKRRRKIMEK